MIDKIGIKLQGNIKISKENTLLLNEHNNIHSEAAEIILRCLTSKDFIKEVDKVIAIGDFGSAEANIIDTVFTASSNTLKLIALFTEDAFNGTIHDFELISSQLGKKLATKTGVNILKDGQARIKIEWSITLTI